MYNAMSLPSWEIAEQVSNGWACWGEDYSRERRTRCIFKRRSIAMPMRHKHGNRRLNIECQRADGEHEDPWGRPE